MPAIMNGGAVAITFTLDSTTAVVPRGTTLLDAARRAGVEIPSYCGARGRCRACRVRITAGPVPPETLSDRTQLGAQAVRNGYRLACQAEAWHDLSIAIPLYAGDPADQILTQTGALAAGPSDPGIEKRLMAWAEAPPDSLHGIAGGETSDIVTMTRFNGELIAVDREDTRGETFGMAFDVGTTTVVGYLIDLVTSSVVSTVSGLNPQAIHGADLISRIAFAQDRAENVGALHALIIECLNGQIHEACALAGVAVDRVCKLVVVGNTVMHHLLLGIDPTPLGRIPFAPVVHGTVQATAAEVGLAVRPSTPVCLLPVVAGFVGADAVGMALSTRIDDSPAPRIAVDIGTNGEVVLGSPDGLLACSAPAGPALEGSQIRCGMRAAPGAIDRVTVTDDLHVHTITGTAPAGICGSGILDATAALLDLGVLQSSGRLRLDPPPSLPAALGRRLVAGEDGQGAIVIAWSGETAGGEDIVLTQADVRQVQLAKAAICSSIELLLQAARIDRARVVELMLAGALGNYLNIESARRVGLLPVLPGARVTYVGNAAGLGAQMALVSEAERRRADRVAARMQHVSLAADTRFEDAFVRAVRFPDGV